MKKIWKSFLTNKDMPFLFFIQDSRYIHYTPPGFKLELQLIPQKEMKVILMNKLINKSEE